MTFAMILFIEPFYDGSHKQFIDTLIDGLALNRDQYQLVTMTGKKWHWRARTSALHLSEQVPEVVGFDTLLTSSVTPLADLLALRPDLNPLHKLFYCHENQLVYPVRKGDSSARDFQYGYNQILSCLVADSVLFNSAYNMNSFLSRVDSFLRRQPDYKPTSSVADRLRRKSRVLYYPLLFPPHCLAEYGRRDFGDRTNELHIIWPHRWEHDKNPEEFFNVIERLFSDGEQFSVSVIGQTFEDNPEVFARARHVLSDRVRFWGFQPSQQQFWHALASADVVVSTAIHEFFGVSVLQAMAVGCWPLCPRRLVYPELLQPDQLYSNSDQLLRRLKKLCRRPQLVRAAAGKVREQALRFSWSELQQQYRNILGVPA